MHAITYIILSILLFSGFTGSTKKKKQSKHEEKKALKRNTNNSSKEKFPKEGKIMLKKEIFDRFLWIISFLKDLQCLLDVLLIKGCFSSCFLMSIKDIKTHSFRTQIQISMIASLLLVFGSLTL